MQIMLYKISAVQMSKPEARLLPVFSEMLFNDFVIREGNALLVNLAVSSLCENG